MRNNANQFGLLVFCGLVMAWATVASAADYVGGGPGGAHDGHAADGAEHDHYVEVVDGGVIWSDTHTGGTDGTGLHHPRHFYAYGHRGAEAEQLHQWNMMQAQQYPWHGAYAHTQYGAPLALVVPPTATYQTNWSWGVGGTTVRPIHHQFARPFVGPGRPGRRFQPTPLWPSSMDQFGVYYVRGPW